ncbi:MAG: DUF4340 domain-containing protein [Oscillospiraceae bacterium]|nr:DUF4340 domain-containing protein [Oscillospiraceae bacterium]
MSEEKQKPEDVYTAENADAQADTIFGDAPVQTAAPAAKQGGLSRNVKWLIAGIAAVVLLAGGLTAVLLLNRQSGQEPSESLAETEKIRLNNTGTDDVRKVVVQGQNSFTVDLITKGDTAVKSVYGIEGYEDLSMDTNLIGTLIDNGNALEADSLVAEAGTADLAKFGLAEPAADVTLQYEDGQSFSFRIGDAAPTGSAQMYCEADGNVYLVRNSLLANYLKKPEQFVSPILLPEPPKEEYPIVESLLVERTDLDYDILLEYDYEGADDAAVGGSAATHIMKRPTYAYLSPDKSVKITHGMFGLTAIAVDTVHPTDADLKAKGLDAPFCTVTMKCDDGTLHELHLGDSYETELGAACYYATFDDVPVIYGLTQEDAQWGTFLPNDITSASIFVTMVWHIGTLDIHTPDGNTLFECKGDDKDNFEVQKNGKECDSERFRQFYHFLLSIYGEEMYYDAIPETDPDISVHLHTQDDKEDYTVNFYKLSEMKTLVERNGTAYVIRTSCLNTLLQNLSVMDDPSKDISLTWQ